MLHVRHRCVTQAAQAAQAVQAVQAAQAAQSAQAAQAAQAAQGKIKIFGYEHRNYITIARNMPINFEPKRLKPKLQKLDFVEKPENRVHRRIDYSTDRL